MPSYDIRRNFQKRSAFPCILIQVKRFTERRLAVPVNYQQLVFIQVTRRGNGVAHIVDGKFQTMLEVADIIIVSSGYDTRQKRLRHPAIPYDFSDKNKSSCE
jgi:hypothetical protein